MTDHPWSRHKAREISPRSRDVVRPAIYRRDTAADVVADNIDAVARTKYGD